MKTKKNVDLPDSPKDKKHLRRDGFEMEMPDAKDIPGQEHVHVPPTGEMGDTTISSADEEGTGILDNVNDDDLSSPDSDVSKDERKVLSDAAKKTDTRDQRNLDAAALDQLDEEGEVLNEKSGLAGDDLDVPGSELDDGNEDIGEEDEENNPYSVDEENEDGDINTRQ
jgi:hypothetical protein